MPKHDMSDRLEGRRYIRLVRCSTKGQADTSIDDQLSLLDQFANDHKMVHVDDLVLEGLSVSMPRQFVEQLIERKQRHDDFDVLLMQDASRLTRSGSKHGAKVEYDLEAAGVEVIFATEQMPDGPYGDIIRTMKYNAAQETAKAISLTATRGAQSALEQGRIAVCRRPPFGIDRLYTAADGTPKYILRNTVDGGQLKLDPTTGTVIERFAPNCGKGCNHNRKQKEERIVLVLGEPKQVEIVRQIYRRYFIDNWGQHRIAQELNDACVVGPTGGQWQMNAVVRIIRNPLYTGRSVANFWTTGIYHRRSHAAPEQVEQDRQRLIGRKRPPMRIRPRTDWLVREETKLVNYLEPTVRRAAIEYQDRYRDARAGGYEPKGNKDRHRDSAYLLKGLLTSKQGHIPMTGHLRGRKGAYKRYYGISKSFHYPRSCDKVLRKAVQAEPIESLVLEIVRKTLVSAPHLRVVLARQAERELKRLTVGEDHANLKAELKDVQAQMDFVIRNCAAIGEDEAAIRLADIAQRRDDLQRRLKLAEAASPLAGQNTESLVEAVVAGLQQTANHLRHCHRGALRRLLELLISKAEVDLETGHLDLELWLPHWALSDPNWLMCLDHPFARKSGDEAHRNSTGLRLIRFRVLRLGKQYIGYGVAA